MAKPYEIATYSSSSSSFAAAAAAAAAGDYIMDISESVWAVEQLLNYSFKEKALLEEALTHSSYTDAPSYQRLEFVGDSTLGHAFTNYVYLAYPDLDQGQLSLLRSANVSTEKLARVAVRHGLHRYVRHNSIPLAENVRAFVLAVQEEDETVVYGGTMKAPKVLADIVEAVAAAIYVDIGFDLQALWVIFRGLLEPIVTPDILQHQPHPVTALIELCQRDGRQVDVKHWRVEEKNIASVYVDGKFVVSSSSEQKENAKLHVAKAALEKLWVPGGVDVDEYNYIEGTMEIAEAKQKLHELCGKKRWPRPTYEIVKRLGPLHEKKYICSVQIETPTVVFSVKGDAKTKIVKAEHSAASLMIRGLLTTQYL